MLRENLLVVECMGIFRNMCSLYISEYHRGILKYNFVLKLFRRTSSLSCMHTHSDVEVIIPLDRYFSRRNVPAVTFTNTKLYYNGRTEWPKSHVFRLVASPSDDNSCHWWMWMLMSIIVFFSCNLKGSILQQDISYHRIQGPRLLRTVC